MRRRRTIEHCEPAVESFLKENPRFGSDGWYVQWCRMGNGGDPSNHETSFREDQLYLNFSELLSTYPAAGMALYGVENTDTDDLYFPVIWGALLAYKKSDGNDDGWIYHGGAWHRMQFVGCLCSSIPMPDLAEPVKNASFCKVHGLTPEEQAHGVAVAEQLDTTVESPASKMYFFVDEIDGETNVMICPIDYFLEEGCCADSGEQEAFDAAMEGLSGFDELTDATYGYEGSVEDARAALIAHGFKQSADFDAFMNDHK